MELLAIVAQLQADLSQRTDSVNAIQRNFQRLSAMHRAEQEELERLRGLQRQVEEKAAATAADTQSIENAQAVEKLRGELKESGEEVHRLQVEVIAYQRERDEAIKLSTLQEAYAEERQRILTSESTAFAKLIAAASTEQTELTAQRRAHVAAEGQHAQLLATVHAHARRLRLIMEKRSDVSTLGGEAMSNVLAEESATPAAGVVTSTTTSAAIAEVSAKLNEVEVDAEMCMAKQSAEMRRLLAVKDAEAQGHVSAVSSHNHAMHLTCLSLIAKLEAEERQSLETAATDIHNSLLSPLRTLYEDLHHREVRRSAETNAQYHEAQRTQLSARLDAWVFLADDELRSLRDLVESWCCSRKEDFNAQHGHDAHELMAAKAEWEALRDTELKAHRAELARVRQETAGRIATAEARTNKAQQAVEALQQAQTEAQAAQQQAAAAADAAHDAQVRAAVAEREALLGRQWYRVQAAQEEQAQRVAELLWAVQEARAECRDEESAARAALVRDGAAASAHVSRRAAKVKEKLSVSQAVWGVRLAQLPEKETAVRQRIEAEAREAIAAAAAQEECERVRLQHVGAIAQLHEELIDVRVLQAAAKAEHKRSEDALTLHVHSAEAERDAALAKAADATTAANDAQAHLKSLKAATAAAAQRIDAAESATESACCCPICLQLLSNPVACVPCGHVFCAGCLLWHARNKSLSSLTASAAPEHNRRISGAAGLRVAVEVSQWMSKLTVPHSRLYCPECGTAAGSTVVELHSLGELAAKFSYRKGAVQELMHGLN